MNRDLIILQIYEKDTPFSAADIMRFGQSSLSIRSTKLGFQYPIKLSIASGQSRGANYMHKKIEVGMEVNIACEIVQEALLSSDVESQNPCPSI